MYFKQDPSSPLNSVFTLNNLPFVLWEATKGSVTHAGRQSLAFQSPVMCQNLLGIYFCSFTKKCFKKCRFFATQQWDARSGIHLSLSLGWVIPTSIGKMSKLLLQSAWWAELREWFSLLGVGVLGMSQWIPSHVLALHGLWWELRHLPHTDTPALEKLKSKKGGL